MKIEEMTKPFPGDHCLVCGAPPAIIGIFIPDDPKKYGAAAGKTRLVRYCLCDRCNGRPDKQDRAEKIIESELTGGVTHAE